VVWLANATTGLSIADPLLELTLPGPHFPVDSLGYERYDDPRRVVREEIDRVAVEHGGEAGLDEYGRLRALLPTDRFDERLWNTIGYRMLERGRVEDAVVLFQANARLYPESANVHDSLGEALAAAGDREGAIASYRRSLELDPANENAVERLRRLGASP
jgi:tetratricopeptide (TPR) repeat protein